jgi:signal transduction histidine kinase
MVSAATNDFPQSGPVRRCPSSQARLIEAGDAERLRLERDLHDGAQQHLVGLLLTLRLEQPHRGAASAALAEAEAELRAQSTTYADRPAGCTRGCSMTRDSLRRCARWERPAT